MDGWTPTDRRTDGRMDRLMDVGGRKVNMYVRTYVCLCLRIVGCMDVCMYAYTRTHTAYVAEPPYIHKYINTYSLRGGIIPQGGTRRGKGSFAGERSILLGKADFLLDFLRGRPIGLHPPATACGGIRGWVVFVSGGHVCIRAGLFSPHRHRHTDFCPSSN